MIPCILRLGMAVPFVLLLGAVHATPPATGKSLTATPRTSDVVVDGACDEATWTDPSVAVRTDFVERSPKLRATPPETTELRVVVDRAALYVAIICRDTQPDTIAARAVGRDSFAIFDDDAVTVKLDAALDHRTTLGFALGAAGGRMDYRGIQETTWQPEFDGVWEGAVRRTPDGWSAEFRIPWSTLGIDADAPPDRIGFDISRDHPRRSATYDWSLIAPPFSPLAASQFGVLDGVAAAIRAAGGKRDAGWSVDLYTRGGFHGVGGERVDGEATGGVDIGVRLGAGFWGLLTVNTDFAEVEPDDQIVNLSQFGLFVPEKRDFFLNAAELFAFGEPAFAQPYYSRRIGLSADGTIVPIAGGLALTGRPAPGLQIGLLEVLTEPKTGATDTEGWTSNLVARVQQDLGHDVAVGAVLTHRQALADAADHNLVLGLDAAFRGAGTPLFVQAFGLVTTSGQGASATGPTETDGVAQVDLAWRGELVRPSIGYAWIGDDARTDLGFLQRTGVQQLYGELELEPRIGAAGLETLTLNLGGTVTGAAADFALRDWDATLAATLAWEAGFQLGASFLYRSETVSVAFPIGAETMIAPGVYDIARGVVTASLPSTWPVGLSLTGAYGGFYGGRIGTIAGNVHARAGSLFRLQVGVSGDLARFDGAVADFDSLTFNTRVGLGFSTDLGCDLYAGYSLLDASLVLQARLRWTWRSGSDLFAVYELDLGDDGATLDFQSLQIKLTARLP